MAREVKKKSYGETAVANSYKKAAKNSKHLVMKCHPLTEQGIPDLITHTAQGRTFYVETKSTGEECSPIQIEFHKRLKKLGIDTYVLDTKVKDFYDLFLFGYTTYPGRHFHKNPFKDNGKYN